MKRRWFIRICFMLPILLCVGGWGWGIGHNTRVTCYHGGHETSCGSYGGIVWLAWGQFVWSRPVNLHPDGWRATDFRIANGVLSSQFFETSPLLGFGYMHRSIPDLRHRHYDCRAVAMPIWFLIVGFSAVLFIAWRKTAKAKPSQAFPVELFKPNEEKIGNAG